MNRSPRTALIGFLSILTVVSASWATVNNDHARFSLDVSAMVKGGGFCSDDDLVSQGPDVAGPLVDLVAAGVDDRTELDAAFVISNRVYFSTDLDYVLPSLGSVRDEDIVCYNPTSATFSLFFDGSANGIPSNADLDAATVEFGTTTLWYSVDLSITSVVGTIHDHDVVQFKNGVLSILYDGDAPAPTGLGIPVNADLDALHHDGTNLYFSLDIAASNALLAATYLQDDEVWCYNVGAMTMATVTGIVMDPRADITSLDEPLDSDGDDLTDYEEITGLDDPATSHPGTGIAKSPDGNLSDPFNPDTDGDGVSDGDEAAMNSDPNDPDDLLEILDIAQGSPTNIITWLSNTNTAYILQSTPDLVNQPFTNVQTAIAGAGTNTTFNHPLPANGALFYRVTVDPIGP